MHLFSCSNVSRYYQDIPTIKDISLHLNEGEIVGLLGESGVGKTTLFNILAGVDSPNSGQVLLGEEDITGKSGRVSYMLQKDLLLEHKTIIDNVALPLIIEGKTQQEAREIADIYFKEFALQGYQKHYPYQLSGGMRQRAALLRTFLMGNPIMLLDEPFSALDAITKTQMHDWYIDIIQKHKMTTLFITHDIDEALLLSHRIYILSGKPGKITREITDLPDWPRNKNYLMSVQFLEKKQEILSFINPNI